MNGCYIITNLQSQCTAYSAEAQELFPQLKAGLFIDNILGSYQIQNHRDLTIVVANQAYLVVDYPLLPDNRLYHFIKTERSEPAASTVTLSCAEITHKIRNPLTSMKLVADMLPVYLPEGNFKETALEVLHKQISRLENYTAELEARAGGIHK